MMNIGSVFNEGLMGARRGMQGLSENAHAIASATGTPLEETDGTLQGMTESLVKMKQNELQTKASFKVIEHGAEVLGALIDIRA